MRMETGKPLYQPGYPFIRADHDAVVNVDGMKFMVPLGKETLKILLDLMGGGLLQIPDDSIQCAAVVQCVPKTILVQFIRAYRVDFSHLGDQMENVGTIGGCGYRRWWNHYRWPLRRKDVFFPRSGEFLPAGCLWPRTAADVLQKEGITSRSIPEK